MAPWYSLSDFMPVIMPPTCFHVKPLVDSLVNKCDNGSTKGEPSDEHAEVHVLSTHALYGGSVELRFDRLKHVYTVDDEVVPNVTTITGVIAKQGLADWS